MLVAHQLRAALETLDTTGQIKGDIVLVPVANPIGLAQRMDHKPMGRFELDTSENFNRCYPDLAAAVELTVRHQLGQDPAHNVAAVRRAMNSYLSNWTPNTELQSMRRTLLLLAHDADYMLDLHCDCEAVLHMYTEDACWPQLTPLAHFLGAQAILLAKSSGSHPIDECLSGAWSQLSDRLKATGLDVPLPQACNSTTVELRGELDVRHDLAKADALAILDWLRLIGVLTDQPAPPVPAPRCAATPLAGSETLYAKTPGVVVFAVEPGQTVQAGDLIAEVINPIDAQTQAVRAGVSGVLYARIRDRYVTAGGELGKIAGAVAFRSGELLGA
jgi:hypothetical protein